MKNAKSGKIREILSGIGAILFAISASAIIAAGFSPLYLPPYFKHKHYNEALEIPEMVACARETLKTYGTSWTHTRTKQSYRIDEEVRLEHKEGKNPLSPKKAAMQAMRYCDYNRRLQIKANEKAARKAQQAEEQRLGFMQVRQAADAILAKHN